jgi:hypothetical protein
MKKTVFVLFVSALWFVPNGADARANRFHKLPAQKGKTSRLKIHMVGYQNGKLVAEVHNPTARPQSFDPQGLYFVPKGKPERAPQRMGAAGPFEVLHQGTWKAKRKMKIPGRKTVKVRLHLFCLDSHRASPSNGQKFSVAVKRLPKSLQKRIVAGTRRIFRAKGAYARPSAKSAAQGHIWKVRNTKWIRLQGERRNEKRSQKRGPAVQFRRPVRRPRVHRNPHLQQSTTR